MARRLPVIQSDESEDAQAAARPRVHWVFIGAGLSVTIWAPLALVATPVGVGAVVASFFLATLASGALVGRFGGKSGPREAALGAVVGAVLISLLGFKPGLGLPVVGIFAAFGMLSLVGAAGGALGAVWGTRSRRKAVLDSKVT